jgi:NTE family protein
VTALSYLTNDYHYIVASLTGQPDEFITETLRQSDVVHIVAAGDEPHLKMAAGLIGSLESSSGESDSRVRVIVSESGAAKRMTSSERTAVLKHPIYATLPEADTSEDSEYSRVIRRIAREIGERLIGLALGSGAALSMAHIGILKVIEKENIPIDIVVGTSMGAVIGALWASGKSGSDMERIMGAFKKKIQTFRMIDLTFPSKGVLKGREVKRFLVSFFGKTTFRDLRMPFKVVCCDIETREEVVLEDGSLADAVMASVAIPGAFEPVMIGGRMLVDGGIINPLATSVLMKRGVSKIIAVNTLPSPEDIQQSKKKVTNILDIIVNTLQASEYLLAEMSCQDVDIAMHPILPTVDWYEFYEYPRVIERGVQEALKFLPQLRELASA